MKRSSLVASIVCIVFFLAVLAVLLFLAPWLCRWYVDLRGMSGSVQTALLIAFYASAAPAAAALLALLALVRSISRAEIFSRRNAARMSQISCCCLLVAAVTTVTGLWYPPLLFLAAAMGFLFLIVRIVRGCFVAALAIQEENSLTI